MQILHDCRVHAPSCFKYTVVIIQGLVKVGILRADLHIRTIVLVLTTEFEEDIMI